MPWIRTTGRVLEYAGAILQADGFAEWLEEAGSTIIQDVIGLNRFKLFKQQRAKRLVWRSLQTAVNNEALTASLQEIVSYYNGIAGEIAERIEYNQFIAAKRIFVVPRFFINETAFAHIHKELNNSDQLNKVVGGGILKEYFFKQFVLEMDEAYISIEKTLKKPLLTANKWAIIGYDKSYNWHVESWKNKGLLSQNWLGHYYLTQTNSISKQEIQINDHGEIRINDQLRASLEQSLQQLQGKLGRFSREEILTYSSNWVKGIRDLEIDLQQLAST